MYWTEMYSFGEAEAWLCTAVNLGKVVQSGGVVRQKQSRCTARDMTSAAGVLGVGQVLGRKLTCSFEPMWHVVPMWYMEFSAVNRKEVYFLLPLHISKKSKEDFRQWLQNYHCYSGSVDPVRNWTGAVWTSSCYSDRINNLRITVGVHTSFLEYNPFMECWEEEWSLWWWRFYSCRQWVVSASHMWKPDQP